MAIPYFPATYGGYQMPMMQTQYAQQQGGLVWVQGVEGAKSHPVAPGQSVLLMDSESNCFFIKSADASGIPLPLRVFDYKERNAAQNAQNAPVLADKQESAYITREEFEARIAQICAEYAPKKKAPVKKEAVSDAE